MVESGIGIGDRIPENQLHLEKIAEKQYKLIIFYFFKLDINFSNKTLIWIDFKILVGSTILVTTSPYSTPFPC